MLVDEEFRKCVAFIFADVLDEETNSTRRKPAATAFFASVPVGVDDLTVIYAITARHVVDSSRPYGPLYVRMNLAAGGFQDFQAPQDSWTSHPETDVAVTRVGLPLPLANYDVRAVPLEMLADDEYVQREGIGGGDEIFFIGLFIPYPGYERNQPIIRFGNISLMPGEKIPVRIDPGSDARRLVDAYLAEARSWGGHSGSPAFVYFRPDRKPGQYVLGSPAPRLLGLVSAHYEIEQAIALTGDIDGGGEVSINAGVAVIIPAQKILETLMMDELVEQRKQSLERHQKGRRPEHRDIDEDRGSPARKCA